MSILMYKQLGGETNERFDEMHPDYGINIGIEIGKYFANISRKIAQFYRKNSTVIELGAVIVLGTAGGVLGSMKNNSIDNTFSITGKEKTEINYNMNINR